MAWRRGDYRQSREFAQLAILRDSTEPAGNSYEGFYLTEVLHDYEAALAVGERMRRHARLRPEPHAVGAAMQVIAHASIAKREFGTAEAAIKAYINEKPGDYRGYFRQTELYLAQRKPDEAAKSAAAAAQRGSIVNHFYVEVLAQIGQIDEAHALAQKNLQRNPTDHMTLYALAKVASQSGNSELALSTLNRVVSVSPLFTQAYTALAQVQLAQKSIEEAEKAVGRAVQLAPKWALPKVISGDISVQAGETGRAVAAYQEAIRLDPRWGEPYFKWGKVLQAQGDQAGATEKFAIAFKLEPFNEEYKKVGGPER